LECRRNSLQGLASIAQTYGISGIPQWANWFSEELKTHRASIPALGIGCDPVVIKGTKEQFLDWLSWGVESKAVNFPSKTGVIRWPKFNLEEIFGFAIESQTMCRSVSDQSTHPTGYGWKTR
jgi:hypothetical protein